MKPNIVYVRFSDGKEFPYLNDKLELAAGDNVYVDGKLAGKIGEVTEILTQFKVSLKYYKYVLQKVDFNITGEFRKNDNFYVATENDALPFEQMFAWLKGPKAKDEEPEEFVYGDGYEIELNKLDDIEESEEPIIDEITYWDGRDLTDEGFLSFVTVIDGKGMAAVGFEKGITTIEFDFDSEKMLMSNIFCDCISPRLCDDMVAVAYALNNAIKGLEIINNVNITLIEEELFNRVINGKQTTVIV